MTGTQNGHAASILPKNGEYTKLHFPAEEWKVREDLAAAYNIMDVLGLNEGICNHLSAMVPGSKDEFLVVAYGLGWDEVTPANLLKVRVLPDGEFSVVQGRGDADKTAAWIHSRIHAINPQGYAAVFHTHQPWATALCCPKEATLPMAHQDALRWHEDFAVDTVYNGLVEDITEGDRIAAAMNGKRLLLHRNHGVIIGLPTIAQCVDDAYYLERACEIIVKAKSTGEPLNIISNEGAAAYKQDFEENGMKYATGFFEMMKRRVARYVPK